MYRMIRWVEDILVKDEPFLCRTKALLKSDTEYEIVLIDTTKSPVERPKRGKTLL
jgi:hypothetical protein